MFQLQSFIFAFNPKADAPRFAISDQPSKFRSENTLEEIYVVIFNVQGVEKWCEIIDELIAELEKSSTPIAQENIKMLKWYKTLMTEKIYQHDVPEHTKELTKHVQNALYCSYVVGTPE